MTTAPLSFTDQMGYYGLRVSPSFDKILGTVRNPLRIPLPDRSAKWYALSPYRALILDAAQKYNDYEHMAINYRQSGAAAPEMAAHLQPSANGADEVWNRVEQQNQNMQEQDAYELAFEAMNNEHRREAQAIRHQQLSSYGVDQIHPTVEAHHEDLQQASVAHTAPVPRPQMQPQSWPAPPMQWATSAVPQAPEFRTFENLNMGQPSHLRPANLRGIQAAVDGENSLVSYDSLRSTLLQ